MTEDSPRKIRVVLCMGEYCSLGRRAERLYAQLQPLVNDLNTHAPPNARIKLETARCLSMCAVGPNCVLYPDDVVFNKLKDSDVEEKIAPILKEMLQHGQES